MTKQLRYNLTRSFLAHHRKQTPNPTTYRNAINQTAHQHGVPERKVHAAILHLQTKT